jgi:hypothetical protein
LARGRIDSPQPAGDIQRFGHYGQRLGRPLFALPQPLNSGGVGGIDQQLVTAQRLDGDDLAGAKRGGGSIDCSIPAVLDRPISGGQPALRSTFRAGDRLSVKAAVVRTRVFLTARAAKRKVLHGRGSPLEREIADNRVSRSAVSATREGITMATIVGAGYVGLAVRAGCSIERNRRGNRTPVRVGKYLKAKSPGGHNLSALDTV